MYNPFSLEGKTILVTGASSGIGQSVAIECSKMGATMIITGRNKDRLDETFQQLEGEGHHKIIADISQMEDLKSLVAQIPKVDGISHNAGIGNVKPVKYINHDDLQSIVETNTFGPILLTQMMYKEKKINKNSSIVFTSSLCGVYCVHFGESIYATSKGALSGFAKAAALEMAANGIRINCVNPSIIRTHIFDSLAIYNEEQLEEKMKSYPLRRLGTPTDVSWAIIYFLSDASSWVTGNDLKIDGGYTLI